MKKFYSVVLILICFMCVGIYGCGAKKYSVNFESNISGFSMQAISVDEGKSISKQTAPAITGYTFVDFFTSNDYSQIFKFEENTINSNTTIYAKYEANELTVNFTNNSLGNCTLEVVTQNPKYNEDFLFKIVVKKDCSKSIPLVSFSSTSLTAYESLTLLGENLGKVEYRYKIEKLKNNLNILIRDVSTNSYSITLPENQIGYSLTATNKNVIYNGSSTFSFSLNSDYIDCISNISIKINGVENSELRGTGTLTINSITDDIVVEIDGVVKNTVLVSLPSDNGNGCTYTIETISGIENISSQTKAYVNSTIKLKVNLGADCYKSTPVLKIGSSQTIYYIEQTGNSFSFEFNVETSDVDVVVSGVSKNYYNITLPTGQVGFQLSFTGSSSSKMVHGSDLTLVFKKNLSYSYEDATLKYGETTSIISNFGNLKNITISNLSQDYTFVVDGVEPINYVVTLPSDSNILIDVLNNVDSSKVLKGSNFAFRVGFAGGFEAKSDFKVECMIGSNKTTLTALGETYTIANLEQDVEIIITGYGIKTYSFAISNSESYYYSIAPTGNISHGSAVNFSITLNSNYSDCLNNIQLTSSSNDVVSIISRGYLTISAKIEGLTNNAVISIQNLVRNRVNVEISGLTNGITMYAYDTAIIQTNETTQSYANYNEAYSFSIVVEKGYSKSNLVVSLIKTENGEASTTQISGYETTTTEGKLKYNYVVSASNASSDFKIAISGVELNVYEVSFNERDDYFSFEFCGGYSASVNHGQNCCVKLVLDESCSQSSYQIYVSKKSDLTLLNTLTSDDLESGVDYFTISNISDDLIISAGNIGKNTYSVNLFAVSSTEPANTNVVNHGENLNIYVGYLSISSFVTITGYLCDNNDAFNSLTFAGGVFKLTGVKSSVDITATYTYKDLVISYANCDYTNSLSETHNYGEFVDDDGNLKYVDGSSNLVDKNATGATLFELNFLNPSVKGGYGLTFAGWYLDAELSEEILSFNVNFLLDNKTIYAKWEISAPTINNTTSEIVEGKVETSVFVSAGISGGIKYQWYLCDESGQNLSIISGQTSNVYECDPEENAYVCCEVWVEYGGSVGAKVQSSALSISNS